MVRKQRASKVYEDRYPSEERHHRGKDELVKRDMLDPPIYLRRRGTEEDIRGKALSFGVLDWKQFEHCKEDSTAHGTKGAVCSYDIDSVEASASSLELDLATGVVKSLELDSKPQVAFVSFSPPNDSFSLRSPLRRKQKEHQASETSPKLLFDTFRRVECQDRRHDGVHGEFSSSVNVMERNQNSLLDQKIPIMTSKKERHASPNRRFSFSFSHMSRSFSSKESSSSVPALSCTSHASAKSGPLTFNDSVYTKHSTTTKPNGRSRTRSGPLIIPKTEKNVPLQTASRQPTMEKNQCSSRSHAILQFTLRKGISLFQFVVDNNVLAATMKSSDSSTRSYTLYTIKEVKNKSGNWLGRHKNDHPFVHTVIAQMRTNSDSATNKSESVLFNVETNEEIAAIVQTRNRVQKQSTTSVILPSGVHTLPKDGSTTPLSLIKRWEAGGSCDCGGWDIGCKLRVLSNDYHRTKSQSFSSFQLFDQERDAPAFKMVRHHDDELHSVEFGSSVSLLEAFFISLTVSSHQTWCEDDEEEAVLMGDGMLKRQTSTKFASNPPVSPIGRV